MNSSSSLSSPLPSSATTSSSSTSSSLTPTLPPSGTQLWLVKLPRFIAEQWDKQIEEVHQLQSQSHSTRGAEAVPPATLAYLHVSGPPGQQQISLRFTPQDSSLPNNYILRPRPSRPMYCFTEAKQKQNDREKEWERMREREQQRVKESKESKEGEDGSTNLPAISTLPPPAPCKFISPITHIADVSPADSVGYRAFLRSRLEARHQQYVTQPMESTKGGLMVVNPVINLQLERTKRKEREKEEMRVAIKGEGNEAFDARHARRVEKEVSKEKRARIEKREVESIILQAFSASRFLSFRQLEEKTQQPKNHLQTIVQEMCTRELKGENKDKYQLKEKYRSDRIG